jgi:hypothetical protein
MEIISWKIVLAISLFFPEKVIDVIENQNLNLAQFCLGHYNYINW